MILFKVEDLLMCLMICLIILSAIWWAGLTKVLSSPDVEADPPVSMLL